MPIILLAPPRTKVHQFDLTIKNGLRYLQPSSRILSLALAVLLYLAYNFSSGIDEDGTFGLYLLVLGLLLPVGFFEIYAIFPINDAILRLGKVLEQDQDIDKAQAIDKELHRLLRKWQFRNWGRAGPALAAASLLAIAGPPA